MKEFLYLQNKQLLRLSPANLADSVPTSVNIADTASCGVMPCWYYDKNELRDAPSIKNGISFETERRYRKEGARFIMTCGTQMGLGHNTMATGVVYFHRFYMFHSFKSFPRYVTACCCLFLAGKVEETPKKCRDIIKTARLLLPDNHFYSFGEDPKEEVMTLERILLQTIKFDLQVEHPYTFLLKYAKCFKGDQQKLQKMVQMAWNFVNDSLSTVVCLQWEPEIIAVALIHLASKLSKFTVVDWVGRQSHHMRWWDMFVSDVTMEILEDICHQVLDLYQSNQKDSTEPTQSPPQKPPSRADSPTPLKALPSTSGGSSPGSALKNKPTATASSAAPSTASVPAAILSVSNTSTTTEINNIQTIKSLANSTPALPPGVDPMSVAALASSSYHMYAPPPPVVPHQMHPIYSAAPGPPPPPPHGYGAPVGVASTTNPAVVLPLPLAPPPPMAPYGAGPPPNAWPNAVSTRVPPPPPPGSSGGGYYQQGSTYGRQQQQQQQRY